MAATKLVPPLPSFCCWMSVLVSVRPLNRESKTARANSAFDSAEMPRMSGFSFPVNAVSGVFGLMSSASDAAGRDASPMASIETRARRSMNHLKIRERSREWKRADYAKL